MDLLDWLEQFSVVYLSYSEIAMVLFHFTLWLVEKKTRANLSTSQMQKTWINCTVVKFNFPRLSYFGFGLRQKSSQYQKTDCPVDTVNTCK